MTPDAGYWGDEVDGRDTLAALTSYKKERDTWEAAFAAQTEENRLFQREIKDQFFALTENLNVERQEWKKKIKETEAPGWGVFAGGGVSLHGDVDIVVGVGLVWKF